MSPWALLMVIAEARRIGSCLRSSSKTPKLIVASTRPMEISLPLQGLCRSLAHIEPLSVTGQSGGKDLRSEGPWWYFMLPPRGRPDGV